MVFVRALVLGLSGSESVFPAPTRQSEAQGSCSNHSWEGATEGEPPRIPKIAVPSERWQNVFVLLH